MSAWFGCISQLFSWYTPYPTAPTSVSPFPAPFPIDVGRIIVAYAAWLDQSTAAALSLTSKDISHWTRSILFRFIKIGTDQFPKDLILFLRKNPNRAKQVQTLLILWPSAFPDQTLFQIIELLPNMKNFSLRSGISWHFTFPEAPQLRVVHLPSFAHPARQQLPRSTTHLILSELHVRPFSSYYVSDLKRWLRVGTRTLPNLTHLFLAFASSVFDHQRLSNLVSHISRWLPSSIQTCIIVAPPQQSLETSGLHRWCSGRADPRIVFAVKPMEVGISENKKWIELDNECTSSWSLPRSELFLDGEEMGSLWIRANDIIRRRNQLTK